MTVTRVRRVERSTEKADARHRQRLARGCRTA
jgi:hypothetical protein